MAKRFTDSEKWTDPWFSELSIIHKLTWIYIVDCCNVGGIIDFSNRIASFAIGAEVDINEFIKVADGRILRLDNGKLFIAKYLKFQCSTVSEGCAPHKKIIGILEDNAKSLYKFKDLLLLNLTDTLFSRLFDNLQEEEGKKKKKGSRKGKEKEEVKIDTLFSDHLSDSQANSDKFKASWAEWIDWLKTDKRSTLKDRGAKMQLKMMAEFDIKTQIEIMESSIRNNYQGLFAPKGNGGFNGKPSTVTDGNLSGYVEEDYQP